MEIGFVVMVATNGTIFLVLGFKRTMPDFFGRQNGFVTTADTWFLCLDFLCCVFNAVNHFIPV